MIWLKKKHTSIYVGWQTSLSAEIFFFNINMNKPERWYRPLCYDTDDYK